jgi:hypothetical protein
VRFTRRLIDAHEHIGRGSHDAPIDGSRALSTMDG